MAYFPYEGKIVAESASVMSKGQRSQVDWVRIDFSDCGIPAMAQPCRFAEQ
jgi:hypothetical protein